MYSTLGEDGLKFALQQTKGTIVVTDAKLTKTLSKVLPDCAAVSHVVLLGASKFADDALLQRASDNPKEVENWMIIEWKWNEN